MYPTLRPQTPALPASPLSFSVPSVNGSLPRLGRGVKKNQLPNPHRSVCPSYFASLPIAALLCKSPQQHHSMGLALPLFSYSYALFCRAPNPKSFIFRCFRTLWQKHPGWVSSVVTEHRPPLFCVFQRTAPPRYFSSTPLTTHYSLLTVLPQNFYPPTSDLRHNPAAQGHHPYTAAPTGRIQ